MPINPRHELVRNGSKRFVYFRQLFVVVVVVLFLPISRFNPLHELVCIGSKRFVCFRQLFLFLFFADIQVYLRHATAQQL